MQSSAASQVFRIGTRKSPLALKQAELVREALMRARALPASAFALVPMSTSGDRIQDRPLADAGGKGLFAKEIEQALLDGAIDLAVHSAKDLPTILPSGLVLAATLAREDPRDVFISRTAANLQELGKGATLGTASLRRQALVKRLRPDLRVITFRGNVETRLRKLEAGEADATLLALAGLTRLGLAAVATAVLSIDEFLPAVGQGIIAIEARAEDSRVRDLLAAIDHQDTMRAVAAERAFLAELDGSCRTPIAGNAEVRNGILHFRGMILKPDGSEAHETVRDGSVQEAEVLGADAGRELKGRAPADFFRH